MKTVSDSEYMKREEHETTGEKLGFSWAPCPRCRSTLGGDRYVWTYRSEGELETDECCVDCLWEINN